MIKQTVTYENLDGKEVTETLYFHISKSEMIRYVANDIVNPDELIEVANMETNPEQKTRLFNIFEQFIGISYGTKSEDGNRFVKDEEATKAFMTSPVYDAFIDELLSSEKVAADFVAGLFPKDLSDAARKQMIGDNTKDSSVTLITAAPTFEDKSETVKESKPDSEFHLAVQKEVERRLNELRP